VLHAPQRLRSTLLLLAFFLPLSAVSHFYGVLLGDRIEDRVPGLGLGYEEPTGWGDTSVEIEVEAIDGEDPRAEHFDDVPAAPGGIPTPPPVPEASQAEAPTEPAARASTDRATLVVEPESAPEQETLDPLDEARDGETDETDEAEAAENAGVAEAGERAEATPPEDAEPTPAIVSAPPGNAPSRVILGAAGLLGEGEARRYLLPNGGVCSDRFQGVWRAARYDGRQGKWVRFSLRITRQGDRLRGVITSRSWPGRSSQRRPPEQCTDTNWDVTHRMEATGSVAGDRMELRGGPARISREDCPYPVTVFGFREEAYYPDRFTGDVDPLGLTFRAVNNDGAVEFDQPYTFRRVSCDP
jgi:hypothetical protein